MAIWDDIRRGTNSELAERMRLRLRMLDRGSIDRVLMEEAMNRLESIEMDAGVVSGWLLDRDVRLLPWQRDRLGIDA
jgi:plasmid maintenance system killer protein